MLRFEPPELQPEPPWTPLLRPTMLRFEMARQNAQRPISQC